MNDLINKIGKKNLIGVGIAAAVLILSTVIYQNFLAPVEETATPEANRNIFDELPVLVSAEGRVVPVQYVNLSFSSPGLVSEVLAVEGDEVKAGESLARLDNYSQAQAQVTAAELQLENAQQAYDNLFDTLELQRALAEQAVALGEDAVDDAQRRYDNLIIPSSQEDIDEAYANMIIAYDILKKAKDVFNTLEERDESDVNRARAFSAQQQAQEAYDQAVRTYNYSKGTASDINIAISEADLKVAQEQLAQAKKNLDALADGPDPDELAVLEAQLKNAKAQLAAAEAAAAQQEIRAPFDGTVTKLDLKVGEAVTPGFVVASVADFSDWLIETTDLAENDISLLEIGDRAIVTLDAFPGVEFKGEVIEIGLQGEDNRGQVTYPVTLSFEAGEDYMIRWEMTAFVDIEIEE